MLEIFHGKRIGAEFTENSRPRHHQKDLGALQLSKTHIVPEAVTDKRQACPISKNVKEMQAFAGIWDLGDFYSLLA